MEAQSTKTELTNKKDAELIQEQWQKYLQTIREGINNWEKKTLRDFILRGAELLERQINTGLLKIEVSHISSYLFKEFIKQGYTISDRTLRWALPDKYKRNYSESATTAESLITPEWSVVIDGDDLIEKDQYGNYRINGKIQTDKPEPKGVKQDWDSSDTITIPEMPDVQKYPISKLLEKFKFVFEMYRDNITTMQDKFLHSLSNKGTQDELIQQQEIQKIFNEYFTPKKIKELEDFVDEQIVNQKDNERLTDWRLRIGRYEKLIAKAMMLGDQFIHEVAKKLHCSAKHMKNDVLKEDIERDLKKFRACPVCGEDIADVINKMLVKSDLKEDGTI